MQCLICQSEAQHIKTLTVRQKYEAQYYLCSACGFMFVANPTWLAEAYQAPINITDTGYVLRNVFLSRKTLILFYFLFGKNGAYLDYAGGYGMLTRLMRDYGLNFLHTDAYTQNLFANGFEYTNEEITALTCFECFEHLSEPAKDIGKMFAITPNMFFSTVLLPDVVPPPDDWEYYGLNHGQHVAFYSKKTLEYIAKKYNVNCYTNGTNLHLFSKRKIAPWYFRFLLSLTKIQLDLFIRKSLKTKTMTDNVSLKALGKI